MTESSCERVENLRLRPFRRSMVVKHHRLSCLFVLFFLLLFSQTNRFGEDSRQQNAAINLPFALPSASQEPLSGSPSLLDRGLKVCTWSLSHKIPVS